MNNRYLMPYAKKLRRGSTRAENHLWQRLRARQVEGCKFRRQQPIDGYIVDFVSFENRLVIELNGGQHAANRPEDIKRDRFLELNGFKVLRFWNNEVFKNLDAVLETIRKACLD